MNKNDIFNRALGYMEGYFRDLSYDWNAVKGCNNPFILSIRKTGSTLIYMPDEEEFPRKGEFVKYLFSYADREHLLEEKISMAVYLQKSKSEVVAFYYDGKKGSIVNHDKVVSIVYDYVNSIKRKWRAA